MSLLIDLVILALLAGVLGYAYLVDRRVRVLMAVLNELEPVVGEFSAAVDKSENSVSAMKSMASSLEDRILSTGAPRRAEPEPESSVAFRTARQTEAPPAGVAAVDGKAELVRSFFETVRSRA